MASSSAGDFLRILSERDARVRARASGEDLLSLTPAGVEARLLELQSTRARLYKAWDVALVRAVRAREAVDSSSVRDDAEAVAAQRAMEYQEIASDLTGAFSAVSRDVICVQAEFQRRSEKGGEAGDFKALAASVRGIQEWEAKKLRLTVRLHQLRWKPNPEHESEIESIQEGLGEIIESINELLRDVKIGVLQLSQSDNEIPRP